MRAFLAHSDASAEQCPVLTQGSELRFSATVVARSLTRTAAVPRPGAGSTLKNLNTEEDEGEEVSAATYRDAARN